MNKIAIFAVVACNLSEGLGLDSNMGEGTGSAKDSVGSLSSGWGPGKVKWITSTGGLLSD